MDLLIADTESPGETQQGLDLEPRVHAAVRNAEEAVGFPVQVLPRRPRRGIEHAGTQADPAEGMRHVTEDVQRVGLERATLTRVVVGADELDPAKQRVVTLSGIVDRGMTHREARRLSARTHDIRSIVPRVRDRDVPFHPPQDERDVHRGRLRVARPLLGRQDQPCAARQ